MKPENALSVTTWIGLTILLAFKAMPTFTIYPWNMHKNALPSVARYTNKTKDKMPNQRAANKVQLTLVIDKAVLRKVEQLKDKLGISRNKTLELLIEQALQQNKGKV